MTREEMWKEFEYQLIRETRISMTMSFDAAQRMTKLGIEETVAKWKRRLEQTRWIPVSEPPKEEGRYICDYGDCIDFGSYHDGHWYIQGAVAYMPLPQPYKGESEVQDADSD